MTLPVRFFPRAAEALTMPPNSAPTISQAAGILSGKVKAAYRRARAEAAGEKTAGGGGDAVDFSLSVIREVARGDGRGELRVRDVGRNSRHLPFDFGSQPGIDAVLEAFVLLAAMLPARLGPAGERLPGQHRNGFDGAVAGTAALEIRVFG